MLENEVAVRGQSLVGKIGTVVSAVRGGHGPGEVRIVVNGIAHYCIAYATAAIPLGTEVLVINSRGVRQVDVEPWSSASGIAEGSL
jgi:membrane protein implicated in regulation of membrane protease activity